MSSANVGMNMTAKRPSSRIEHKNSSSEQAALAAGSELLFLYVLLRTNLCFARFIRAFYSSLSFVSLSLSRI